MWERARAVANARTNNFVELAKLAALDPKRHLRFADWSGVSFNGCDLRGFDFTGARLIDCDFNDALITGARFDQAEIDQGRGGPLNPNRTNLRRARDWASYLNNWKQPSNTHSDDHLPVGAVFQDAPFAPEMVIVPAGSFLMGAPMHEPGRKTQDMTPREVSISEPFAVGRFAVTFDEYRKASEGNARGIQRFFAGGLVGIGQGDRPRTHLDWEEAQAYVAWLADITGKPYRLLREIEWEYCARARTTTAYWWGDTITTSQANFGGTSTSGRTVPVTRYDANPWGLYQMLGNTWEWCQDKWIIEEALDPWQEGYEQGRNGNVIRGGSWLSTGAELRAAHRSMAEKWPGERLSDIGFRVARELGC